LIKPDAVVGREPWLTRRFAAAGVELVGDVGGDPTASPVILLHGGGQTRHSWGGAMKELIARGYYVVNLDARGHGDSDWAADGDYSLDSQSADLARVIDTVASPPALVGASMGGAVALFLTGTELRPTAALILADIVPRIEPQGAAKILAFMSEHRQGFATLEEAVDAVAAYNPHRSPTKDAAGLMKNLRRRDGRLYWHWDPRMLARHDWPEARIIEDRLNQAAARVQVPTLLVRGLRSDIVSGEGVADLQARIPHLEVFDVDGAGHMVAGDKNDAFNRGIFDFLRQHLPPLQKTAQG
jgi:pimeloyl-ACP methyl ester carboxylesterase